MNNYSYFFQFMLNRIISYTKRNQSGESTKEES